MHNMQNEIKVYTKIVYNKKNNQIAGMNMTYIPFREAKNVSSFMA